MTVPSWWPRPALVWCAATLLAAALGACGSGTEPATPDCGPPPYFTTLPVAAGDIDAITVIGGLGAPGHTLPTAHAGIYLTREDVPVTVPGDLRVTRLRRTTYLASPTREGESDYTVEFAVCGDVTGWFGHLTALDPSLGASGISWTDCQTYSTAEETVEACTAAPASLELVAGSDLGSAGMSEALGLLALDFGLLDDRVEHYYAAPQRHPGPTFHAVCPWEQFDATNQGVLFAKLKDQARPDVVPAGQPRCGTMEVDVDGTAKGVWAEAGVTGPVAGDERAYITLANYPYRPEEHLALSLGPVSLGATVAVVPRQASGRVNRAFEQVAGDGSIYCYTPEEPAATQSWILSLSSANQLTIERLAHSAGASPCAADPATWAFGGGVMTMVR